MNTKGSILALLEKICQHQKYNFFLRKNLIMICLYQSTNFKIAKIRICMIYLQASNSTLKCLQLKKLFQIEEDKFQKLTKLGISENLIALLGSNIQQYQQIMMRYGLVDFYEQQSYQKLFKQTVLNKQINSNQINECFIELLTYDQIKVKVTVQNKNHVFLDKVKYLKTIYDLFLTEEQRLCFFYKNLYITFFEIDLCDLRKVIEIRKQNLNNCNIQFLEENIEYSSQCLYLLEKFYSNLTQDI
ncbi:hypothetical protein ABPG72_008988 [Tetrahymena utriculariae]